MVVWWEGVTVVTRQGGLGPAGAHLIQQGGPSCLMAPVGI